MLFEGAELTGESGKKYLAVSPLGQANVWTAVESNDMSNIVVIKEPSADDTSPGWPNFINEMVMHELLKDCSSIRGQVDRILPTKEGAPPMLVLEIFETTLWTARTKRPFTSAELKAVMKDALIGLRDVHDRGQVYGDLKMPNIMVDGFNPESPSDPSHLTAKLGDLGIVMPPFRGKVQPVTYRAPEVYFKGEVSFKADIWSWGLIYCHLLEAQTRFSKTGLYDDLDTANGTVPEREQAVKHAMANDYEMQSDAYFRDMPLPPNDERKPKGNQWERLRERGLPDGEVDFLRWVMRADPRKRPSAVQILDCGWLDKSEEEIVAGFQVPLDAAGRASLEFDPRRPSPVTATPAAMPTASTTSVPLLNANKASTDVVQDALDQVYATRATCKRHQSQLPEGAPTGKTSYVSASGVASAPDRAPQQNDRTSLPVPTAAAEEAADATVQESGRKPVLSTQSTGTYLSYH